MRTTLWLALFPALVFLGCSTIPPLVVEWRSNMQFETIEDQQIAFKAYGSPEKPVVVLLHGLPTSSYLYRNIAPAVADQGYYVVTPDFVGFGGSTKPIATSEYELGKQAERLDLFLSHLKISKFDLVVHDMGALIAFEYMLKRSDRVRSLLVLNTTAYRDGFTPPLEMNMLAGGMGGMMSAMMSGGLMGPFLTGKFIRDNMAYPDRLSPAGQDNYWWPVHEGTTIPMRTIAQSFGSIMDRFPVYQDMLRQYPGRASLLWGTRDKVLLVDKIATQFQRDLRLAESQFRRNEGASHFIQEDDPTSVIEEVVKLLRQ